MIDDNFWSGYFKVYDALNTVATYTDLLDRVCQGLKPEVGELVLDVGSGTGNLALKLGDLGCRVVGMDFCRQGLERHKAKDAECCVVLADLRNGLPFQADLFDGIVCNNVLYALSQDEQVQVVKEFHRVLKPGGRVALANPKLGWTPMAAYLKSIAYNVRAEGRWVTAKKLVKSVVPTIKMLYYNGKLRSEGEFHYFQTDEQRELLASGGFLGISDTGVVYADQVLLNSAHKRVTDVRLSGGWGCHSDQTPTLW